MVRPLDDERLAEWLDGRMSARELSRFEAEMRVQPELRHAAESYRAATERIRAVLQSESDPAEAAPPDLADRIFARLDAPRERTRITPLWASVCAAAAIVLVYVGLRLLPERHEPYSQHAATPVARYDADAVDGLGSQDAPSEAAPEVARASEQKAKQSEDEQLEDEQSEVDQSEVEQPEVEQPEQERVAAEGSKAGLGIHTITVLPEGALGALDDEAPKLAAPGDDAARVVQPRMRQKSRGIPKNPPPAGDVAGGEVAEPEGAARGATENAERERVPGTPLLDPVDTVPVVMFELPSAVANVAVPAESRLPSESGETRGALTEQAEERGVSLPAWVVDLTTSTLPGLGQVAESSPSLFLLRELREQPSVGPQTFGGQSEDQDRSPSLVGRAALTPDAEAGSSVVRGLREFAATDFVFEVRGTAAEVGAYLARLTSAAVERGAMVRHEVASVGLAESRMSARLEPRGGQWSFVPSAEAQTRRLQPPEDEGLPTDDQLSTGSADKVSEPNATATRDSVRHEARPDVTKDLPASGQPAVDPAPQQRVLIVLRQRP